MSKKDVLLYIIGISVFIFISIILTRTQVSLQQNIIYQKEILNKSPHLEQTLLRYDFLSKVLLSNATRKNIAFLIGTMMIVLGTILIISRIESSINANMDTFEKAKFQITTSSPGVFVVLLGTIIVITTVLKSDFYEFKDEPITTEEEFKNLDFEEKDITIPQDTTEIKKKLIFN